MAKKKSNALPPIGEDEFKKQVIQLAQLRGWLVAHFRPARVLVRGKETWRTPCEGNAAGFPDLVLSKGGRTFLRELKTDKGAVSPDQQTWLIASGGAVWRPENWPEIERFLAD